MWGFFGESVGSGSLELWERKERSFDFLGTQSGEFREKSWEEDSTWDLGEIMILTEVSGSYLIESWKVLEGGLDLESERFERLSSEEWRVGEELAEYARILFLIGRDMCRREGLG